MKANSKILLVLLLLFSWGLELKSQNPTNAEADAQREEIQRYFGYENLLPAYLTLPLDVSQNNNERGYFTEIGFVFIILFPILLLFRLGGKRKMVSLGIMLLLFLINCIYVSTSYIWDDTYNKIRHGSISNYTSSSDSLIDVILGQFYIGLNFIGALFMGLFDKISGSSDYTTYPILICFFIGIYIVAEKIEFSRRNQRIGIFALLYTFFWLLLSSGILWYGYLLLPLFVIMLFLFIKDQKIKIVKYASLFLIVAWISVSIANRISMIPPMASGQNSASSLLINSIFFNRSLGKLDDEKLLNKIHPGINRIRNKINRDQTSLVLQIGTTLGYFIDNNTERCIIDFQLGFTDKIINRYESKNAITKAFKAAGIKYILVDLNTHTLDRTPEQTLIKKFQRLLQYVSNNERLMLLGTDRVVEVKNQDGTSKQTFGLSENIVYNGSYAVYEIL